MESQPPANNTPPLPTLTMNAINPFDRVYYIRRWNDGSKKSEYYIPAHIQFNRTTLSVVIDGVECGKAEDHTTHWKYIHTITPIEGGNDNLTLSLTFFPKKEYYVSVWDIIDCDGECISDYISEDGMKITINETD